MSLYFSLRETLHCILLPLTAWSHHAAVYSSDICFFPTNFMSIAPCICFLSANSGARSNLIWIYCGVFFSSLYSSLLISSLLLPCIPFIHFCIQDPRLLMWFVSQWTSEPYQVQHRAVLDSAAHDIAVQYSTVQYMRVQYSIAQYNAIWSTHTTSKLSYNYSDTG